MAHPAVRNRGHCAVYGQSSSTLIAFTTLAETATPHELSIKIRINIAAIAYTKFVLPLTDSYCCIYSMNINTYIFMNLLD